MQCKNVLQKSRKAREADKNTKGIQKLGEVRVTSHGNLSNCALETLYLLHTELCLNMSYGSCNFSKLNAIIV
jgi:hypothetical protein